MWVGPALDSNARRDFVSTERGTQPSADRLMPPVPSLNTGPVMELLALVCVASDTLASDP